VSVTTFETGLEVSIVHGPCHTDGLRPDLIVHLPGNVNCPSNRGYVDMIWGQEHHVLRRALRSLGYCMWRGALYDRHSLSPTPDTIGLRADIVVRVTR
jgi:hypothetical protein